MNITVIPLLILAPVLLITSLFVKPIAIRALCLVGGLVVTVWLTSVFSSIPGMYEQDHRNTENRYHRKIISELDRMLTEGQMDEAKRLTKYYLKKTEDSSFMRNPLHEIVQSLRKNNITQAR